MVVRSPTRVKFSTKESEEICALESIHCADAEPLAASCVDCAEAESTAELAGAGSDWLGRGCESAKGGKVDAVAACGAEPLACPVGPFAKQRSNCGEEASEKRR